MGRGNDGRAHGGGRSINSAERRAYRSLQALITLPLSISNSSFSSSSSSESSSEEVFVFVVILLFLVPCCASPRLTIRAYAAVTSGRNAQVPASGVLRPRAFEYEGGDPESHAPLLEQRIDSPPLQLSETQSSNSLIHGQNRITEDERTTPFSLHSLNHTASSWPAIRRFLSAAIIAMIRGISESDVTISLHVRD